MVANARAPVNKRSPVGTCRDTSSSVNVCTAAAVALDALEQLRAIQTPVAKSFEAEVARIAREKVRRYGCELIARNQGSITRFLIRDRQSGEEWDLIANYFHHSHASEISASAQTINDRNSLS